MEDNTNPVSNPVMTFTPEPAANERSLKQKLAGFFRSMTSKKRIIVGSLGTLALIGFLGAGLLLVQQRQNTTSEASGPVVSLSANKTNPNTGETITVAVSIDTKGLAVTATRLVINYDPNIFDFVSETKGSYLPFVLATSGRSPGVYSIALGCDPRIGCKAPASPQGLLESINLRVKAKTTTTISFAPATRAAAVGYDSNNIIQGMNNLTINGAGSPQPTVTPTVVPSPTSTPIPTSPTSPSPSATPIATPPAGGATVTSWLSTKNKKVCVENDSGKTNCTMVIDGVNIYGTGFGTGTVNVKVVDTQNHTYQGMANVTISTTSSFVWVSADALKAAGFPYTQNDTGSIVYAPPDFLSWKITIWH